MGFSIEEQDRLTHMLETYQSIEAFEKKYKKINYVQFDYAVMNDLTLFTIEMDYDFESLEKKLDHIIKVLPAIKNIFSKPILHLKEQDEVLPVESVRRITSDTIHHIAGHSELWSDITKDGIKPLKLLTRIYKDNYGIYENIVFCKAIDDILSFVRTHMAILKNLIYTNQTIEINLLERVHHLSYFLALGKLHTGYNRNFDQYYVISVRCLKKLESIYDSIVPRLKRPVYKYNQGYNKNIKLNKTNILSMHKDYHQIYALLKYFKNQKIEPPKEITNKEIDGLQKNYFDFCLLLILFSIGHFNFTCDEEKEFLLKKINLKFQFKDWNLTMKKASIEQIDYIDIELKKDKIYKVVFIPTIRKIKNEAFEFFKETIAANEYIFCHPYSSSKPNDCYLSVSNIESFRRIQQILFRSMIYSDEQKKDCPFCNHSLNEIKNEENALSFYVCPSCRTEIHDSSCLKEKKNFFYTKIFNLPRSKVQEEDYAKKDRWLFHRKAEGQMFYRNITKLTYDGDILCPYCNEVHKN